MTRQYELVERILSYQPNANEALLNRAYVYAMKAHGNQKRASGAPYFSHPLEVAAILAEMRLDDATIATALLHDTIEDTEATRAEIDALFGAEIGTLVDGLTKIKKLDLVTKKAEQAENFRKLLLAISSDIRVLLVKLADRLHNMRTLEHMKPAKRKTIAQETMDIYAPLAGRMGMQWLREELEELSFRWLNPEAYATVLERLKALRAQNQGLIDEIHGALTSKLEAAQVKAVVAGREKKPYAIWSKMERKQISLEQLSDIYAFRIVVPQIPDCYRALAVVHTSWHTVPGRFKDYISNPKQNDYQSIHTTIVGPKHQRVELQIRTEQMHSIAEFGVAAHALYKDGGSGKKVPAQDSSAYRWLRRLVGILLEGDNPEEFLEHTKLELFHDQVFCFTPKGRLIALPRGANCIDFAYAVHTQVGNTAVGAKINGRPMPLATPLRNGDEVEIVCSEAQSPPVAWERLAITGKARSAIRRASRDSVRAQYEKLGREILDRAFRRRNKSVTEEAIKKGLPRLSQKTIEEVMTAVGRGELASDDVFRAAFPEAAPEDTRKRRRHVKRSEEGWFGLGKVMGLKFRWPGSGGKERPEQAAGIPIRGLRSGLPVNFADGGAVPGDRIVGILTPGQGITIYPIHAKALKEFDDEPERWIDVTWDIDEDDPQRFPATIAVTAMNEPGSLAQIASVIGEADGNIQNIKMTNQLADYTEMLIDLDVWDLQHLNEIVTGLRAKDVVSKATRAEG
ncbi:MAG: bifunctional (p)ppGpp synthetase/guanosine-3',5'-bis(diphosphate) 3'-pyrophosphohydrolase [Methyloceanibacter sp.]|uniref:RelA/SpoT family protein n=1 Tax=Methyloceanibacter sp. TaxID=1965321 RepID=UPI001DBB2881|nr:bifunctional (p)ppGpp synthetase/guanosine-3',5'-bis(diphosphate) 3'-pyrophosphohydrolase [Methyloceanibacter sp.]MCB1442508.1 bifunctional (p)ppGpp synthetase/guanosine-3',5'-bis(diphosphate) 3'-pyrophosphohydrolase [Methyloceanibacter sp.]MCC0058140.1 bifunctional (p)ppGpp synthetase/guanosine-3',5'-bis(diphosphate) 3'-pyrophosphohydrolase [Hyphomicrobiaceae bacterium]